MARPVRLFLPGYAQHVIQRGNNRADVFFGDGDRLFYLDCLADVSRRYGCAIHAYVLMSNHVHLLMTPNDPASLPRAMQSLGRRYVAYINKRRERSGHLWQGRHRAIIVDTESYFLICSRYIELNPVRAGLVPHPAGYVWSSFRGNALGRPDPLLTPHPVQESLGPDWRAAYGLLFDQPVDDRAYDVIRAATEQGYPVGNESFRDRVATVTASRTRPGVRGGRRSGAGRKSSESDSFD